MLYASTPRNSDLAANLLTIQGDPALATFGGTSAVWSPRDTLSALIYNGNIGPSDFLASTDVVNSPVAQGIKGLTLEDIWNLIGLTTGPVPSLPIPSSPLGQAVIKGTKEVGEGGVSNVIDWKFWLVSIFLALLGLIFVLGGVLSFR
mgnify:CR=1 FL=1